MSIYLSKEVKKAVARAMTPIQRKIWKNGGLFSVCITRNGKLLHRWGGDDNIAKFTCNGRGKVIYCNLTERTWSFNKNRQFSEAISAIDYFVYGNSSEYEITII